MDPSVQFLDSAFWITSGAILALLILSALFSGSETALTAASRGKLRARADKGSRGAERALKITEDNERLIGSVLLGNNLVNILAASLATAMFTRAFGRQWRGDGNRSDDAAGADICRSAAENLCDHQP